MDRRQKQGPPPVQSRRTQPPVFVRPQNKVTTQGRKQTPIRQSYPAPVPVRVQPAMGASGRRQASEPMPVENLITLLFFALLGAFLLVLAAGMLFYGYYQYTDRIVPNVYAAGINVGGLTVEDAAVKIQTAWNIERKLTASDGSRTWEVAPGQFGLSVDSIGTAELAYAVAHRQDFFSELRQMGGALQGGYDIEPIIKFDVETAREGLQTLAEQVNVPPLDASLRWQNGTLSATPSVLGYSLDVETTLAGIEYAPLAMLQQEVIPLQMVAVGPRIQDASSALAEAQQFVDTPFSVTVYEPVTGDYAQWAVPRETLGEWLKIEKVNDAIQVGIEQTKIAGFFSQKNSELTDGRWIDVESAAQAASQAVRDRQPVMIVLKHQPTSYTVQPGDTLIRIGWKTGFPYYKILQANPDLDPEALRAGQVLAIPSVDDNLPLPVIPGKRIKISIGVQRLWTYENGQQTGEYVISTGIDRSPTQPGIFQVQTHELSAYASLWDLTMPHFIGIYQSWPGFWNGMHGLPTLSGGQILWANILGKPASYGCIILDLDDAENLYGWAEEGVVVEIVEN